MFSNFKRLFRKKKVDICSYPDTSQVVWNKGMAMLCDRFDFHAEFNPQAYQDIKKGEIVWVKGKQIQSFFRDIFPKIKFPFILVTGDSTISLPLEVESPELLAKLESPILAHWFAQNYDQSSSCLSKISPLPLGIDFHSQFEKTSWRFSEICTPVKQEAELFQIRDSAPNKKNNLAYADFQFNNSSRLLVKRDSKIKKDRHTICRELKGNPAVFFQTKKIRRRDVWKKMTEFQFIISPHGSGLDCHRTWEALVLGSYVIVESSVLDPLYAGLPVKIVEDFKQITPDNLTLWKNEFDQNFKYSKYFPILTNQYWITKIRDQAQKITVV